MDISYSKSSKIIQDVDHCLSLNRVDEQINFFIHIFQLLDDDTVKSFNVDRLKNKLEKIYNSEKIRRLLDYYYSVVSSDAAYVLFAEQWKDTDLYDLDSEIYKVNNSKNIYSLINETKLEISKCLGLVKNDILSNSMDLEKAF